MKPRSIAQDQDHVANGRLFESRSVDDRNHHPNNFTIILSGTFAAIALGAIAAVWLSQEKPPDVQRSVTNDHRPAIQRRSLVITAQQYRRLEIGMSYSEAATLLGREGEEISRNRIAGIPNLMEPIETVMFQWTNPGFSNMNAMFQNDRLISKAQFGLR